MTNDEMRMMETLLTAHETGQTPHARTLIKARRMVSDAKRPPMFAITQEFSIPAEKPPMLDLTQIASADPDPIGTARAARAEVDARYSVVDPDQPK